MANKAGKQLLDTIEFSKTFKNLNAYDQWAQTHQAMIDILREGWRGAPTRELIVSREVNAIRLRLAEQLGLNKDKENDAVKTIKVRSRKQ